MSRPSLALAVLLCAAPAARAEVDYKTDIKPIFEEKCGACHGVLKQEAGLRLDAGTLIRGGSDQGSVLDFNKPAASSLIQRVTTSDIDQRMPPEGAGTPATAEQILQLTQWIKLGAPSPEDETIVESPSKHWAYQPPVKPELPRDLPESWSANPIDALMYAKWREVGLAPTPLAEPSTLLRRLHFDVIGLPPTLDEQDTFLADTSSGSWSVRVDRLLDDPAYGEKWGRHWMDVWRYSDWDGYKNELRGSQRHIWHWRDWIIESLNADKGYDEMVREMLAGDEIAPENLDVLRATGFLVRNFHKSNRDIWLDATVEHTAKAFLGMTIACARCHDHKYDPLEQREYYAFRAIFEPHQVRTERLPGQPDTNKQGLPRAYDADLDSATYLYVRGNEKNPDKKHPLEPSVPAIVKVPFPVDSVAVTTLASHPFLRDYVETEDVASLRRELQAAQQASKSVSADEPTVIARQRVTVAESKLKSTELRWAATKARLNAEPHAADLALQAAHAERSWAFNQSLWDVLKQQAAVATSQASTEADEKKKKAAIDAAEKKLAEVERKLLDASVKLVANDDKFAPVGESYPTQSSGRRTALANWITHRDNPLTARVAINHIWMRHFGEPLVENVSDLGLRSPRPLQQQVLDWLAVELVEHDWSMKHIHRLILNSRTYRLTSSTADLAQPDLVKNSKTDPDNLYFWHANVRRLDAEVVRDSLLAVAGSLDRTMGGEDLDYHDGEKTLRRSLYFRHAYEKQMPMLVVFDAANPSDCYRRSESIVPQQALALANSPLAVDQARRVATQLSSESSDDASFIARAYRVALGRKVTASELSACERFLQQQAELLNHPENLASAAGIVKTTVPPATETNQRARENLVHVLINHNDFVTVR